MKTVSLRASIRCSVVVFVLLTYAISWLWFALLRMRGGFFTHGAIAPLIFMWIPGTVSIVCRLIFREGFGDVGWRWHNRRATLAAIWAPILVGLVVYVVLWGTGLAPLTGRHPSRLIWMIPAIIAIGVPIGFPFALGEELGWRAYLLDRLIRSGWKRPVFLTGITWAVWHLPLVLTGEYMRSPLRSLTALLFILMVLGSNSVICRLRLDSGNVWVPTLMHAVHNAFLQEALQPVTTNNNWHIFLGGEAGALTVTGYGIIAWLLWRNRARTSERSIAMSLFGQDTPVSPNNPIQHGRPGMTRFDSVRRR